MNKGRIDPANVQIRPMKEEDVGGIAVIDNMYSGAPQEEYYREKLGSADKGPGINISLVAEARMPILQAECKR